MSEKEKLTSASIAEAMNILRETRGPEYVEGLIAGISIGTVRIPEPEKQPG